MRLTRLSTIINDGVIRRLRTWNLLLLVLVLLLIRQADAKSVVSSSPPTDEQTEYLQQFGYLSVSEINEHRSIEEVWEAVRELQRMAGLPQTGRFDAATVELMRKPRCGQPDVSPSSNEPQSFTLNSGKWDKHHLTYRVQNSSPYLDESKTRSALWEALSIWSRESPLHFTEIDKSSEETADIEILFGSRYHGDGYEFDGRGNVLAHAFAPGSGRGGDVHFDNDEVWATDAAQGTNIFAVAAHEFGHSLGIGHSKVHGALMYPWYDQENPTMRLQADDIQAITYLYGPNKSPVATPVVTTPRPTRTTTRRVHVIPAAPVRPARVCGATKYDAITTIRRQVYAFRKNLVWRMNDAGDLEDPIPVEISRMWPQYPHGKVGIDAIYERLDGIIVIFKGDRYWEFDGYYLNANFPPHGRTLTTLGISSSVRQIDDVIVGLLGNRRTYLFSGYAYWRLKEEKMEVEDKIKYPRDVLSMWRGIPAYIDAAFTNVDGKTYFFKDRDYWLFNGTKLEVAPGYPKPISSKWTMCPERFTSHGSTNYVAYRSNMFLSLVFIFIVVQCSLRRYL